MEPHGECANTVVSQLHKYICTSNFIVRQRLVITADNHSTNKCNTMLQYLEWVVRHLKLFSEIILLFQLTGHTKDRLDQHHAEPAKRFYSQEVLDMQALEGVLNANSTYHARWMPTHWNWDLFFEQAAQFQMISKPHMFQITEAGIRTKLWAADQWSEWAGQKCSQEPIQLLGELFFQHTPVSPSAIPPTPLTATRKTELQHCATTLNLHSPWLNNVLADNFGLTCEEIARFSAFPMPNAISTVQHMPSTPSFHLPQLDKPPPKPPERTRNLCDVEEIMGFELGPPVRYQVRWRDEGHSVTMVSRKALEYVKNNTTIYHPQLDEFDKKHGLPRSTDAAERDAQHADAHPKKKKKK